MLQVIGFGIALLLLLVGGLLLGLQTESGATAAVQWVVGTANPLPNTELTVERASGSWIRSIRLTNVTLSRTDTSTGATYTMAHVDTLAARYRLWPLVQGRLHVTDVTVAGPEVTAREAPDSTWDWEHVLPASDEQPAPADTSAAMPIRVDRVQVRRGHASTVFYAENRDSVAHVRDLTLRARDLTSDSTITGRIDTLGLRTQLPDTNVPDLQLGLRGALSASAFTLDTLQLDSPRSHVRGNGTIQLAGGSNETTDDINLHLRAAPFALRDLTPVLPALDVDPDETIRLDLHATGSSRRMTVRADGQFSNGGTLSAKAVMAPVPGMNEAENDRHYQLNAEVRRLTTSLLGPPDSTQNRLSATLSANLSGPSLTSLNGPVRLQLTDTHWNDLHTDNLVFASTLRDGTAPFTLNGTLNEATLEVNGETRPLDEAPDATLTAHVGALNLARFAPDAGLESDLSLTAELTGESLGTAAQTLDLSLGLAPSTVGKQSIAEGRFSLGLQPDRAQFDGQLRFPTGAVEATGVAALDGSEQFALKQVRLVDVNPMALLGDTTSSRLTGTATVKGRGFSPETMRLEATASLEDTHYGPYHLSALTTQATLSDATLTATTNATLNGGDWTLELTGTPFANSPAFELVRGRFDNVDIGPLLQDTTQSSRLAGTLRGRVQGTDPATMTADAGLTIDSSRVNRQVIESASLDLRLADAQVDAEFALDLPNGRTRLAATAQPFADVPTFEVTEGTFEGLNVGALADLPALRTALTGSFALTGRGATAETIALDADLSLASSQINNATVNDGTLTVSAQNGQGRAEGRLSVAGGRIALRGQVDNLAETPSYTAETTVSSLNVGALAGTDSLTARIDTLRGVFDAQGTELETLTASTRLSAAGVQVDDVVLSALSLRGGLQRGRLTLDTLDVQSNVATGTGGGTIALTNTDASSSFSFEADITDPEPLKSLLGASQLRLQNGQLEARIYGSSLANQRFDGELTMKGLLYDDVRLADAELNFNGRRGQDQWLQRFEANGTLGYLSLPALSVDQTQLDVTYDGTTADLSTKLRIDPTHRASMTAQVHPGETDLEVILQTVNLTFEGDKWTLLQEASVTVGDQYRIRGLLLHSGPQQIAVDGLIDPQGTQSLVATIEEVRLGAISSLFGFSGLDGRLSGSLDLTGPATAPTLDSRLSLALRTNDQPVGTLRLNAGYDDLALTVDAALTHTDGSTLTANGTLPTDLRLQAPTAVDVSTRPVQATLSADRFSINWIDPFLDPATVRDIRGTLNADVSVRGTLSDPTLAGTASLANGGLTLPALETTYRNSAASLQFSNNQLRLEKAVLHSSNDGRLRASGTVNFPQLTAGEFDIDLKADDFIAIDTRAYRRVVIGGNMRLQGSTEQPVLNGTVQVRSANIFYNEALAESEQGATSVPLTEEDQLTLENRFGIRLSAGDVSTFDAYDALAMTLTVRIKRNTWLRSKSNPEMNVQFLGDLDLSKEAGQDAKIFGSIEVVTERSTLRQFGQEFQITEGVLTFNGDPATPYLNLTAVYEQRARGSQGAEVQITLSLEGRPESLTPTLSSDPPMDTRNILSYLATGRPADQLLSGGDEGGGGGNMAAQMALGQAANFVENLAASELGLDVVRVQLRTSGASYLTVGRYFTPRLFVSIEQPVSTSNLNSLQSSQYLPDLTVEYQLLDTLMLRALNNQQSLQFDLLFEYAY